MERELWKLVSELIDAVDATFIDSPRFTYRTALIVRVHLWAAFRERSISWACERCNWPPGSRECRAGYLPDQSTMSRRSRGRLGIFFERFLAAFSRRISANPDPRLLDLKRLDGKPLIVAAHSTDKNATWGRAAGGLAKGYKLHVLWGTSILPEAFVVAPMNMDERKVARRLLQHLVGCGYVVADGNYDANDLFALANLQGYQLLAPRDTPGVGLGGRRQRPGRLRSIELLERNQFGLGKFGPKIFRRRRSIEGRFGNLTCGVGALTLSLPPFVRRIWRVRTWVTLKLILFGARCLLNAQQIPNAA